MKPLRRDEAPLWGFSYDRAESAIHLLLAFIMVGGAAAMIWNLAPDVEKPAAPVRTAAVPAPAQPQIRPENPAPAPVAAKVEKATPAEPVAPPVARVAPPLAAAVLSPTPIANAPAPLPPPPAALREKLGAPVEAPATEAKAPEPTPVIAEAEIAPPESAKAEPKAEAPEANSVRTAHCYLKLSGRVQTNGTCRVEITDNGIIFQLPKPLEIMHDHGRTWTATLGGRALGKVYKSGSCWGGRGFYACKNG